MQKHDAAAPEIAQKQNSNAACCPEDRDLRDLRDRDSVVSGKEKVVLGTKFKSRLWVLVQTPTPHLLQMFQCK